MADTYDLIASTTLSSTAADVTFSSLGSYTDIRVEVSCQTSEASNIGLQFNGDTATNYDWVSLNGRSEGGSPVSAKASNAASLSINWYTASVTNAWAKIFVDIMSYRNSTRKTILSRAITTSGNSTFSGNELIAGTWRSTSAITSIKVISGGGTFNVGTTITLYGIQAA
jgi:hypothetical protein